MADVTITISGGALSADQTIPDATVTRLNDMIQAYYAGLAGEGADLAEMLLAGVINHLKRDTFKFEKAEARLRASEWTPPDLG